MLTEAQKDVKIAYLEQENAQLRGALLDYQITTGKVTWTGGELEKDPTPATVANQEGV